MAMEKTCALIKPDAVKSGYTDEIIEKIKQNGFSIVEKKELQMTEEMAKKFCDVHEEEQFKI